MWSSSRRLGRIWRSGRTARTFEGFGEDEDVDRVVKRERDLLSAKKVIYAANMDEAGFTGDAAENERLKAVQAIADAGGRDGAANLRQAGRDIAGMDAEEKEMFLPNWDCTNRLRTA